MRRVLAATLTALGLLLAGAPGAVAADGGADLRLESEVPLGALDEEGISAGEGTFVALGPALRGYASAAANGTVRSAVNAIADECGPKVLRAVQTYTCENGSGSFEVRVVGRRTAASGPHLTFAATVTISDGTGAFSDLDATGVGTSVIDLDTGVLRSQHDLDVRTPA